MLLLSQRSLIRRGKSSQGVGFLSLHRCIRWNILFKLARTPPDRKQYLHDAVVLLQQNSPLFTETDIPEKQEWPKFQGYITQVQSVLDRCLWPEPTLQPPKEFLDLLSKLTTYMWHAGFIEMGNLAWDKVQQIYDKVQTSELDPRREDLNSRLGILLSFKGVSTRERGRKYREEALKIRETHFVPLRERQEASKDDEIRFYNAKSDIAFCDLHDEEFEKVEEIMEECRMQYRKWSEDEEEEPFEYCKYYFLMAFVHMWKGKAEEAVKASQRAVDLMEMAAGEQHPLTQTWKFSLGTILCLAGDVEEALKVHEKVRQERIKICSDVNHNILESYSMSAALLYRLDRLDEAE